MIKEIVGNLITLAETGQFDVICHGCNTFHKMNSGIAPQIKNQWPEAYQRDLETPYGDKNKLGTISYTKNIPSLTVVNCYTQHNYGKDVKVYADYDAIEKSLTEVKTLFKGKKIGLPKIGAGLARGDWNIIKNIIEKTFCDQDDDVTIVIFEDDEKKNKIQSSSITNLSAFQSKILQTSTPNISKTIGLSSNLAKQISTKTKSTAIIMNNKKYHGKRVCKICNQSKSINKMVNYVHGVWCCQENCHDLFAQEVKSADSIIQSQKSTTNVVGAN